MGSMLDLAVPEHAYLFGILQGDGHLYRNPDRERKGGLTVELGAEDQDLLIAFQRLIPCYSSIRYRRRDTNFKEGLISATWSVCSYRFRQELTQLGLPVGRKSERIAPPAVEYS